MLRRDKIRPKVKFLLGNPFIKNLITCAQSLQLRQPQVIKHD